jgi:Tfp pilus assembly protein PilW
MFSAIPRRVALLLLVGAVTAAGGCDGGNGRVASGGAAPAETSTTTAPPSSIATTSTTGAPATSTTRRSGSGSTSTTTHPTTSTSPRPREVVPQQGDRVVAVFVATGATLGDPSFTRAKARLTSLGYRGHSGGDTGCSRGAKEALPQLQAYSLSLEFATDADAARFASLYGKVIGTASVTVYCAD